MARQVAIIGYSFRFPGQEDDCFWQNLLKGRNLITSVEPGRWARENFLHPDRKHPGFSYTFSAGSIGDVSGFDAGFFGISPREASAMDPQQRLLLELSWEAFENAGIRPSSVRGTGGGVFIGLSSYDYALRYADDLGVVDSFFATGNTGSVASNRISYFFDLHGPSMTLDTACSSSLVAFHQACRSIVSKETDFALAGGVSLHLHPYGFVAFSKASMLSEQGRCRVFDASADGYVRSEGGGIFILKDHEKAVADGNPVLAVVAGTGVNADGRKSGITVPNPDAQAALVTGTCQQARIRPSDIDYLEMHGTGTAVGDPIEARAMGMSIGRHRAVGNPLPVGSVKSNLGHLEPASGVPGLVKSVLCIQHRTIPATIGLEKPNPSIDFQDWNLDPVTRNRALAPGKKITIGVNSFGFGGVNAHVLLQSPDAPSDRFLKGGADQTEDAGTMVPPLLISAVSTGALQQTAAAYAGLLSSGTVGTYYHIAYSAAFHRDRHRCRAAFFGRSVLEIKTRLEAFAGNPEPDPPAVISLTAPGNSRGPAFVYSGNGAHWFEMGRDLLDDPVFLATVREIDGLFQKYADFSLEAELAGKNGTGRFDYTEIAQPALFALQAGVTRMLLDLGIRPTAVTGHSVGEIAAAWAAGILSLPDAVKVIYHRSRLQGGTRGRGQMTAVALGEADTRTLLETHGLDGRVVIAGVNSPRGVTLAGDPRDLTCVETALAEQQVRYKRLDLAYAFHSPAMDPIRPLIRQALASLHPVKAQVPFFSTVTGTRLDGDTLNAEYWWQNLREPVRFEAAVNAILEKGDTLFVEIGPHAILSGYVNDTVRATGIEARIYATLTRNHGEADQVRRAARQVMTAGPDSAWKPFFPVPGRFVPLPSYPWQKEPLWLPHPPESVSLLDCRHVHPFLGRPLPRHEPAWENHLDTRRFPMLADHVVAGACIFPGAGYVELALAAALECHPENAVVVVEELEILNPLLISDQVLKTIRVTLDAEDACIRIESRNHSGDDLWIRNARGRILRESPGSILSLIQAPDLPSGSPDFGSRDHYDLARRSGLDYGPAFCCIHHGWIQADSATALLDAPASAGTGVDGLHLHPALLDSAFQLSIQLLKPTMETCPDMAFVPVKIGQTVFDTAASLPYMVCATLLGRTRHSLKMSFALFDRNRTAVAVFQDVRFRAMPLAKNHLPNLDLITCHGEPRPLPGTMTSAPLHPESLYAGLADMADREFRSGADQRYAREVDPLLDALCRQFFIETLQQLTRSGPVSMTRETVHNLAAETPQTALFFEYLIRDAEAGDHLTFQGPGQVLHIHPGAGETAREIWNILVADYPDYFALIDLAGRTGLHLASILTGNKTHEDLFPAGTTPCIPVSHILGPGRRHKLGRIIQETIRSSLSCLPAGQRFSFMEIGLNTPLFAADAFQSMDRNCCDYTFAADTRAALDRVAFLRDRYPGFEFCLIDPPAENEIQEKPVGGHDLIVVVLDFTSLSRSLSALNYAGSRLNPGGTLVLIGHPPSFWIDVALGGCPGWFEKQSGGMGSGLRSAGFWRRRLSEQGLVSADPIELSPGGVSDLFILAAHPGAVPAVPGIRGADIPRRWIILTDEKDGSSVFSRSLAQGLQSRKHDVRCVPVEEKTDFKALVSGAVGQAGRIDGIIHLAGLGSSAGSGGPAQTDCAARQAFRCSVAARLARACEETGAAATTLWMVTSGAAQHLIPESAKASGPPGHVLPGDSVLAGFARTMMNEAICCVVRSLDIPLSLNGMEAVTAAVIDELEQPDDEPEVIFDSMGKRFVPRLRAGTAEGGDTCGVPDLRPGEDAVVRLGFRFPGRLQNLWWESVSVNPPENDEVDIQVHATGLNFRDVMYTLGLLSDEAVENGFAGPSLGLEFAGVILRTGKDAAARFSPGDRVAGFGSSCFAGRVTTKADAVCPIPPGMSFEAAATIPVVFLTVYYSLKHMARLEKGETVLIHGGAGGVGIAAIQTARALGAEIYATAGTEQKRDFLKLLGVEHIYDSRSYDFAEQIMLETGGRGVDIVLNSLAGEAVNRNLQVLKPFGRFLELGKRDFYENTRIGLRPFRNNISYFGIDADQLMKENPALTGRLFSELMELFAQGILYPLPCREFEAGDVIDAFRCMQQARHIGKVVITYRNGLTGVPSPAAKSDFPPLLTAEGTCLVTGGLSGFGLKTAEWLADKGVRHLILISRSGPVSPEARQTIDRLEQNGAHVLAQACDVTDRSSLQSLLETAAAGMPPVRGIVHAAAVIEDGLVTGLDQEQIHRVLAPKILGGLHLHQLTLGHDLDFFILFSSATTFFGNPGQAGYVGANCWLESLAGHRRALGLPATAISWGPIGDTGFLARRQEIRDALMKRMGGTPISSDTALAYLEKVVAENRSGVGLMELEWPVLSQFLPGSKSPRFSKLTRRKTASASEDDRARDLHQLMNDLSEEAFMDEMIRMLQAELGEILRIPSHKIDPVAPLTDMGMDSLMGVELVAALESRFKISLPVLALRDSRTLTRLAHTIHDRIKGRGDDLSSGDPAGSWQQIQHLSEQHGVETSREDAEKLARRVGGIRQTGSLID